MYFSKHKNMVGPSSLQHFNGHVLTLGGHDLSPHPTLDPVPSHR